MREWRKLYSSLLSSERLASASFEARWLFTLLTVAQDDEGRYPWTRTMIRALVATTEWDITAATKYRNELAELGVLTVEGDFVKLRKGKELNGNPRPDRHPDVIYPESEHKHPQDGLKPGLGQDKDGLEPGLSQLRVEKSRVEKSREEKSRCSGGDEKNFGEVFEVYEKNIGILTPIIRDNIIGALGRHPPEWVTEAIKIACSGGKRNWRYIEGILNSWQTKGAMDNDVEVKQHGKEARGQFRITPGNNGPNPTGKGLDAIDGLTGATIDGGTG